MSLNRGVTNEFGPTATSPACSIQTDPLPTTASATHWPLWTHIA